MGKIQEYQEVVALGGGRSKEVVISEGTTVVI